MSYYKLLKLHLFCLIVVILLTPITASAAASCTELSRRFVEETPPYLVPKENINIYLTPSHLSYSPLLKLMRREEHPLESVLRHGKIVQMEKLPAKDTSNDVYNVTFEGGVTGVWKPHEEVWRSNYRTEVLAYELSELFAYERVPLTVDRQINGKLGSVQLFKESSKEAELGEFELYMQSLFDFIIDHRDRHFANYLVSLEKTIVSIDNGVSLSGKLGGGPLDIDEVLLGLTAFQATEKGKKFLDNIRKYALSKQLKEEVSAYVGAEDAQNLLDRMQFIIKYSDSQLAGLSKSLFLKSFVASKGVGDYGLGAVAQVVRTATIPIEEVKQILESIISSEEAGDYALGSVALAIKGVEGSMNGDIQLLKDIISSDKAGDFALANVAYAISGNNLHHADTEKLLQAIIASPNSGAHSIDRVVQALRRLKISNQELLQILGSIISLEFINDHTLKIIHLMIKGSALLREDKNLQFWLQIRGVEKL